MSARPGRWPLRALVACLRMFCLLVVLVAANSSAAGTDVEACRRALTKAGEEPEVGLEATAVVVGPHRVLVGNTEEGRGFVCLLGANAARSAVADVAVGLDVVGKIDHPRVLTVAGQPLLATEQTFRGGSNARRQRHVLYAFVKGKVRTALELSLHESRVVGAYTLSERNTLATTPAGLHVEEHSTVGTVAGPDAGLYRSSRTFVLRWSAELAALVEGVGTSREDYRVDRNVWLRKGQRFGYRFQSGVADAGGLTLTLVREDGATATVTDLEDLSFLHLEAAP